jgi:hypothetical protein
MLGLVWVAVMMILVLALVAHAARNVNCYETAIFTLAKEGDTHCSLRNSYPLTLVDEPATGRYASWPLI